MSTRIAWASDIHLNFLEPEGRADFLRAAADLDAQAYILSGDIAEADSLIESLDEMERILLRPVYFVLGNHDFYRGSIDGVRAAVRARCRDSEYLRWLPDAGVVPLGDSTALVGVDGWGDARNGDYENSPLVLSDFLLISDFAGLDGPARKTKLQELGDESARRLAPALAEASRGFKHVYVATHVPPFPEACSTEGRIWHDEWLPYFTCRAVGDEILQALAASPEVAITVLCGHTHRRADGRLGPRLRSHTAPAEYRHPIIQAVFETDAGP